MQTVTELHNADLGPRALLAVGLSVFGLWSLRRGKRLRGALAGLGAVALGYTAATRSSGVVEHRRESIDIGSATDDDQLRCAICGDPIVAGQSRRPNEDEKTVHQACLDAPA